MKNIALSVVSFFAVLLSSLLLTSCQAIGDIFSAGVYVGIFIVILVVVIIVVVISKLGRKG